MERIKESKGFSLVELAIGLAIITVLILSISLSAGLRDNARTQSAAQSIQALRTAAEGYLTSGRLNYAGISISSLKTQEFLPNAFSATGSNPWGGNYDIKPNSNANTQVDVSLTSVPKKDSSKLLAYFKNTAFATSYEDGKGNLILTF